jgi:adenosine deaminase/aminodeoxyfutalosine deaminase
VPAPFDNWPKAELHLHLEGAIEPETLREIQPSLTLEEIRENTRYSDFPSFLKAYVWVNKRLRTPEAYAIAARRLFEKLAAENIRYAELQLSAGVILWKDLPFAPVWDALARETARAPLPVYWILDAIRQFGVEPARKVMQLAVDRREEGVVAFGIGGDEINGPASWFAGLYQRARDHGLRLTCHAGETAGPDSIREALAIGAERIGHGIAAAQDADLMSELSERQIPLEISVSSNIRTGVVASLEDHPVRLLFDAGIPVILNTDDPALFECSLAGEYALLRDRLGFTEAELGAIAANAFRFAFGERKNGSPPQQAAVSDREGRNNRGFVR